MFVEREPCSSGKNCDSEFSCSKIQNIATEGSKSLIWIVSERKSRFFLSQILDFRQRSFLYLEHIFDQNSHLLSPCLFASRCTSENFLDDTFLQPLSLVGELCAVNSRAVGIRFICWHEKYDLGSDAKLLFINLILNQNNILKFWLWSSNFWISQLKHLSSTIAGVLEKLTRCVIVHIACWKPFYLRYCKSPRVKTRESARVHNPVDTTLQILCACARDTLRVWTIAWERELKKKCNLGALKRLEKLKLNSIN